MRDAWLPLGLALVGGGALLACGQAFELTGSAGTSAGVGGASSASAVGSGGGGASSGGGSETTGVTSSTSTGNPQCMVASDCPGVTSICGGPICKMGHCGTIHLQPQGDLYSKLYGDCHVQKCTAAATLVSDVNDADVYDDANGCTDDTCSNGVPANKPKTGSQCDANGVCNAKGACVACLGDDDCGSNLKCDIGHCVPDSCKDGIPNLALGETDVDCGGTQCAPCADTKYCANNSDCQSGVCKVPSGEINAKCIPAACTDQVKNGNETDVDCGGSDCQVKCQKNLKCKVGKDCLSGVCQSGTCHAETCTDGVMNGAEKGIDCGTGVSGCPTCPSSG